MWIAISAGLVFLLVGVAGVLLTALTLAGLWLPILCAIIWQVFFPETFSLWTLGGCTLICLGGEAVELLGAAHGAKRSGGGRAAAWGATIGSFLGAILGSLVFPIVGTILGAVVGAGVGALSAERGIAAKPWRQSLSSATGAAKGRALALVVKTAIAGVVGLWVLIDAVF